MNRNPAPPTRPAAARPAAARPAAAPNRSRFAGVQAALPLHPIITPGEYVLRVTQIRESSNPGKGTGSATVEFVVVNSSGAQAAAEGATVAAIFRIAGSGAAAGQSRFLAFVIAAAGYESQDDMLAERDLTFVDALLDGTETLDGAHVLASVTPGRPILDEAGMPTGLHYNEIAWYVAPRAE